MDGRKQSGEERMRLGEFFLTNGSHSEENGLQEVTTERKRRKMNYYLGLDLGTGSIKTVLFDVTGKEIAMHFIEYPHTCKAGTHCSKDPVGERQSA